MPVHFDMIHPGRDAIVHAESQAFAHAPPAVKPGPLTDARCVPVGSDDPAGLDVRQFAYGSAPM